MSDVDRRTAGFKDRTRLAAARERLLDRVAPHGRTGTVPLEDADGRLLDEAVTATRSVPGYDRAAVDGYAVRARDTFCASDRSPAVLRLGEAIADADGARPDTAVRVHAGSDLPEGSDAVVRGENAEAVGDELAVFDAVSEAGNVGATVAVEGREWSA